MVRLRRGIQTVDQYIPGRPAADASDGPSLLGLASNECPYPPFPSVAEAMRRSADGVNRYASAFAEPLREEIASRWEVPIDRVAAGAGSMTLCTQSLLATCDHSSEVVFGWPSFVGYPLMASVAGARAVPVALKHGRHDLEAMSSAVTGDTRVIFICNPNNPTGTVCTDSELRQFLSSVPGDCLVILDEAYVEFSEPQLQLDTRRLLRDFDNLMVSRTFSKAYGLAGLRVGYLIAEPGIASTVQSTLPFNVSGPAMHGAIAALRETELMQERINEVRAERARVLAAARSFHLDLPDTQGNFIWYPTRDGIAEIDSAFERLRILSRALPPFGVRVTLGTRPENDRLIAALEAIAALKVPVDSVEDEVDGEPAVRST